MTKGKAMVLKIMFFGTGDSCLDGDHFLREKTESIHILLVGLNMIGWQADKRQLNFNFLKIPNRLDFTSLFLPVQRYYGVRSAFQSAFLR